MTVLIHKEIHAGIMPASVKSGSSLKKSGGYGKTQNLLTPWEDVLVPGKLLGPVPADW